MRIIQINTRKIGDKLENKVLNILEPYFSKTAGSGSVFKDGDLRNKETVGEVKVRSTAGASITGKDLSKLKEEARKQCKEWLFICENYDKDLVAMMDLNFFSIIYEGYLISLDLLERNSKAYTLSEQSIKNK